MIRNNEDSNMMTAKQVLALILALIILSAFFPGQSAFAEEEESDFGWEGVLILDDPEYFMFDEDEEETEEDTFPVITSVGKKNVKINGVKSKGTLVKYTIPEQLLRDDPNFLALMIEAEKYIGYPYVYGAANPDTGFDCSGFVCWVFRHSGVYKTKRLGANGLYSLCTDIPREEARPGDLVFFEKTMGTSVKADSP